MWTTICLLYPMRPMRSIDSASYEMITRVQPKIGLDSLTSACYQIGFAYTSSLPPRKCQSTEP